MNNQNQLNAEADVVKSTQTLPTMDVACTSKNFNNQLKYTSKAIPTTIKFSSRASVKIVDRNKQEHYYTIEYGEERQIQNFDEVNIDKERQFLIDDCNNVVDNQVKEIVETFL